MTTPPVSVVVRLSPATPTTMALTGRVVDSLPVQTPHRGRAAANGTFPTIKEIPMALTSKRVSNAQGNAGYVLRYTDGSLEAVSSASNVARFFRELKDSRFPDLMDAINEGYVNAAYDLVKEMLELRLAEIEAAA